MEQKYKDIFYIDGFEIVPVWKQCGKFDPSWSDDEKSLWNSGKYDHHIEYLPIGDPDFEKNFLERYWYVWKDYKCGDVVKHKDNAYTAEMKEVMMGWSSPTYNTLEEAIGYVIKCYHAKKEYMENEKGKSL